MVIYCPLVVHLNHTKRFEPTGLKKKKYNLYHHLVYNYGKNIHSQQIPVCKSH